MFSYQQGKRFDELGKTLLIAGLAALVLSLFFPHGMWPKYVLLAIFAVCFVCFLIRALSANTARTYAQNQKFLTVATGVRDFFRNPGKAFKNRPHRAHKARKNPTWGEIKKYKYFICPQCAQRLRVPRGKGRLLVTCTKCGNRFEARS